MRVCVCVCACVCVCVCGDDDDGDDDKARQRNQSHHEIPVSLTEMIDSHRYLTKIFLFYILL